MESGLGGQKGLNKRNLNQGFELILVKKVLTPTLNHFYQILTEKQTCASTDDLPVKIHHNSLFEL